MKFTRHSKLEFCIYYTYSGHSDLQDLANLSLKSLSKDAICMDDRLKYVSRTGKRIILGHDVTVQKGLNFATTS